MDRWKKERVIIIINNDLSTLKIIIEPIIIDNKWFCFYKKNTSVEEGKIIFILLGYSF